MECLEDLYFCLFCCSNIGKNFAKLSFVVGMLYIYIYIYIYIYYDDVKSSGVGYRNSSHSDGFFAEMTGANEKYTTKGYINVHIAFIIQKS